MDGRDGGRAPNGSVDAVKIGRDGSSGDRMWWWELGQEVWVLKQTKPPSWWTADVQGKNNTGQSQAEREQPEAGAWLVWAGDGWWGGERGRW